MNKNLFLYLTIAVFAFSCTKDDEDDAPLTEKTLTLKLGPSEGQATYVNVNNFDAGWANAVNFNNQSVTQELPISTSNNMGAEIKSRAYLSFNINQIPTDAEIVSAELSLYGMSTYFTIPQGNLGDNTAYIQRVTENWNQATLTWNTQPGTTEEGQVTIPKTTVQYNHNVTDVNVTALVKAMRTLTPDRTAGFCIKLKTEQPTNTLVFASSRNSDQTKRPKLVIVYKN